MTETYRLSHNSGQSQCDIFYGTGHKVITEYTQMMVSGEPQDVYNEGLRENFRRRLSSRPMPDYLFVDASQLGAGQSGVE
jgi:hypothetical protein